MKPETKGHIVYYLSEMFRESKPIGTEKEMQKSPGALMGATSRHNGSYKVLKIKTTS